MITDQEVEAGARAWCLALDIDPDYPHGGKADAAPWWKVEAPRIRAALEAVRALRPAGEVAKYHLIFDGFPGPDGPRFIELENDAGHSIGVGEWVDDPRHPGWAQLVLPVYASAIISALAHVSGTPKTEHVASDMLLATPTAANASEGDGWIRDRVPEKDGFYLCWTECPPQSHPLQSIRWRSRDSYWLTSWPIIAWRDAPASPRHQGADPMTDTPTTTRAINLPDETWALIERFSIVANSPRDNMIARLAREGAEAMSERWPTTFGRVVNPGAQK